MLRITQFLTIVLLFSLNSFAQISGTITDAQTKQPLASAAVYWEGTTIGVLSNNKGTFVIPSVKGINNLIIKYIGYSTQQLQVAELGQGPLNISLQQSIFQADEVIVSATRANAKAGIAYSQVSQKQLEKINNGQDLPMLLQNTPSVVSTSDAGAGIGYTGLRIRGTDATRINVMVNGIPINDSESQGVFWVNMPDLASSVASIQIQRGVGTSVNGAGAFGASVNILSNQFSDSSYLELNNSVGSFHTLKNTLKFGTGLLANHFTVDARLSGINSNGYIDRAKSSLASYYLSAAYFGKKSFVRFVNFSGREKTYQAWNGVAEALLDTARRSNVFTYANQTDNYTQTHYQLLSNHSLNPSTNLSVNFHFTPGKGYYEEKKLNEDLANYNLTPRIKNGTTISTDNLIRQKWLDNNFYGITYNLEKKAANNLALNVGGAYNIYNGDHFGEVIRTDKYLNPNETHRWYFSNTLKKDLNIYAKANRNLGEKLSAYADLQYRSMSISMEGLDSKRKNLTQSNTYNFINPKAGLHYDFNTMASAYVSYSVAQKEPNRTDFVDNNGLNSIPKPEKLQDIEFGYKFSNAKVVSVVNFYGMFYKDQLAISGAINDTGDPIRINLDKSYRMGLEYEVSYRFNKRWNYGFNATFSRNKVKAFTEEIPDYAGFVEKIAHKNTNLAFSPGVIVASDLAYQVTDNFSLNFQTKYIGLQYLDNTSNVNRSLKAYTTSDLRANYKTTFGKKRNTLSLGLSVFNLFNNLYENNGYTYSYLWGKDIYTENFYYPQAGTNYLLHANVAF
jgi:iron complex outermembrane recepter protein